MSTARTAGAASKGGGESAAGTTGEESACVILPEGEFGPPVDGGAGEGSAGRPSPRSVAGFRGQNKGGRTRPRNGGNPPEAGSRGAGRPPRAGTAPGTPPREGASPRRGASAWPRRRPGARASATRSGIISAAAAGVFASTGPSAAASPVMKSAPRASGRPFLLRARTAAPRCIQASQSAGRAWPRVSRSRSATQPARGAPGGDRHERPGRRGGRGGRRGGTRGACSARPRTGSPVERRKPSVSGSAGRMNSRWRAPRDAPYSLTAAKRARPAPRPRARAVDVEVEDDEDVAPDGPRGEAEERAAPFGRRRKGRPGSVARAWRRSAAPRGRSFSSAGRTGTEFSGRRH